MTEGMGVSLKRSFVGRGSADCGLAPAGDPDADEPALAPARARWAAWQTSVRPQRADLKSDMLAGPPGAISGVPDGMAVSVPYGVDPAHGSVCEPRRPDRGRVDLERPTDGDHDDERGALATGSTLEDAPPGATVVAAAPHTSLP